MMRRDTVNQKTCAQPSDNTRTAPDRQCYCGSFSGDAMLRQDRARFGRQSKFSDRKYFREVEGIVGYRGEGTEEWQERHSLMWKLYVLKGRLTWKFTIQFSLPLLSACTTVMSTSWILGSRETKSCIANEARRLHGKVTL
jgi:hypothetical protein